MVEDDSIHNRDMRYVCARVCVCVCVCEVRKWEVAVFCISMYT